MSRKKKSKAPFKRIPKDIREKVWNKFGKKCAYCGKKLEYKAMQVDHIVPKFKNGPDDLANYNPSCRGCNFYKSTFSMERFRKQMRTLHERLNKIFIVRLALRFGILRYKKFDEKFYFEKHKK